MPNIDLHTHVLPQKLINAILHDPSFFGAKEEARTGIKVVERDGAVFFESNGRLNEIERELYDVEAKIEAMDRMRIDVSGISISPPAYLYNVSAEAGLRASRLSNDGIAEMAAHAPARFRGMATLPMQDPDAAIAELERVVREHRFKAVELGTSVEGIQLADAKFRPVLKTIEQLGCFIFAHPYSCSAKGGMNAYEFTNTIGIPLDEVLMTGHLMFSGALDELTRLRIVIAHGGGYVPYQIGRLEHGHRRRPGARVHTQSSPRDMLRRFYFDALTHDPKAARFLIDQVGADRVVLGTDNPFDMGYDDPLGELERIPNLTAAERRQICEKTALDLLGEA